MTGTEALTILRENGTYLDKNFTDMSDGAIALRLNEMEEAIKYMKRSMKLFYSITGKKVYEND